VGGHAINGVRVKIDAVVTPFIRYELTLLRFLHDVVDGGTNLFVSAGIASPPRWHFADAVDRGKGERFRALGEQWLPGFLIIDIGCFPPPASEAAAMTGRAGVLEHRCAIVGREGRGHHYKECEQCGKSYAH
jgi:hypothetical protein